MHTSLYTQHRSILSCFFFFSSRRRHTRYWRDWSSDVCSSDLLVAAAEALALGSGGISATARATGLSRAAIRRGIAELQGGPAPQPGRIRRPGGGRKKTVDRDPTLLPDLEALVEPTTRGDPESPLRWTCKSVRKLARALRERGHRVSHQLVAELLQTAGYSLQANRKTREGSAHPDRDAQFAHIAATSAAFLARGDPVISVDAKKKELIGDFKNGGREGRAKGGPHEGRGGEFPHPDPGGGGSGEPSA